MSIRILDERGCVLRWGQVCLMTISLVAFVGCPDQPRSMPPGTPFARNNQEGGLQRPPGGGLGGPTNPGDSVKATWVYFSAYNDPMARPVFLTDDPYAPPVKQTLNPNGVPHCYPSNDPNVPHVRLVGQN